MRAMAPKAWLIINDKARLTGQQQPANSQFIEEPRGPIWPVVVEPGKLLRQWQDGSTDVLEYCQFYQATWSYMAILIGRVRHYGYSWHRKAHV